MIEMFKNSKSKIILISSLVVIIIVSIVVGIVLNSNKKKETKVTTNSLNETIKVAENTSKETVSENTKSSEINNSTEESKTEEITENESETEESSYIEENITEEQKNYSENNEEQNYIKNENENSNNESNNTPSNEPEYNPPAEIPTQPAKKGEAHIVYKPDGTWDLQNTYFDNSKACSEFETNNGNVLVYITETNEFKNFINENNLNGFTHIQAPLSSRGTIYIDSFNYIIFTKNDDRIRVRYNRSSNYFYIVN